MAAPLRTSRPVANGRRQRVDLLFPAPAMRHDLPIYSRSQELIDTLKKHQVLIVAGETGSGKSTQLPRICLGLETLPAGRIVVTQPRRIAAQALARRVCDETGATLGREVGYRVRFDEQCSDQTGIVYCTDGMLLTEIGSDPLLSRHRVIIIDEAHERNLNIDFLLGYLRRILPQRSDLRVIISSATIDASHFSEAFGHAPVIEVSGRLYPVEIWYQPDEAPADPAVPQGDYVSRAVEAVREIVTLEEQGDVLVFMPTEADIHESIAMLKPLERNGCRVLPLFARLTKAEQERIFSASGLRTIIVATNIAETSLTVPGIRFVVDTGLVRMNRYSPRMRLGRLPVEPVSQAGARQRAGRCGRVSAGICIRLFSEEDLRLRPAFTTPELQRSNIAGVILRMKRLNLGAVEQFPFIDPPDSSAIRDGQRQLLELGALDSRGELTALGRRMADLPLDPPVARIVLQAHHERCLAEAVVIAAGLSIIDPRERPLEQREMADAMHKRFVDAGSDFLTLLRLWQAYQQEWESLRSQNALRRFCRTHFLSFNRMREWHELNAQIIAALPRSLRQELHAPAANASPEARSEALHRCMLAGFIANAAQRCTEGEGYMAARNRPLTLFPGSVLYRTRKPWLVCAQIVETSRVFGRIIGPIEPHWIEELAPHLCRRHYGDPFFDESGRCVRVHESVTFLGLTIVRNRPRLQSHIEAARGGEVFVREGLVRGRLRGKYRFLEHNLAIQKQAVEQENRHRRRGLAVSEEALCAFYLHRLGESVCNAGDLDRRIKEHGGDTFLRMNLSDALAAPGGGAFPDCLQVGNRRFPLSYVFAPGQEDDGCSVTIPATELACVPSYLLDWPAEPLWASRIEALLRTLPPPQRSALGPSAAAAVRCAQQVQRQECLFREAVAATVNRLWRCSITPGQLDEAAVPPHLCLRVVVTDEAGGIHKIFRAGHEKPEQHIDAAAAGFAWPSHLQATVARHERQDLQSWDFDSCAPVELVCANGSSAPALLGYPALDIVGDRVDLRLFPNERLAVQAHESGYLHLAEIVLAADLAWVESQSRIPKALKPWCSALGGVEVLGSALNRAARRFILWSDEPPPHTRLEFEARIRAMRERLMIVRRCLTVRQGEVVQSFRETFNLLHTLCARYNAPLYAATRARLQQDLSSMVSFLTDPHMSWSWFDNLPRYLHAYRVRIERAWADTARFRSRSSEVQQMRSRLEKLVKNHDRLPVAARIQLDDLGCLVDEMEVSLFAQGVVKTGKAVSPARVEKAFKLFEEAAWKPEKR